MMPLLPPFFHLFIFFLFMRNPLNLVDIDTDSYIDGSLLIWFLVYLYLLSSLSETLFGPIRKYFIISVFAIQYRWILHNIYMPLLLDSHFSQAIWWNTRTVDSFFFVLASAFMNMNENKRKKSLIMIWISFLWVASFFFNFILILILLLDLQAISYITIIR